GVVLAAIMIPAAGAQASVYSFEFDSYDGHYQVTGLFDTSSTPNGSVNTGQGGTELQGYEIQSITLGTVTGLGGGPINPTVIPNPNQPGSTTSYGFIYDNNLFASAPYLNLWGVLFTTQPGGSTWNLWGTSPTDYELYTYSSEIGQNVDVHGTMTVERFGVSAV